MKKFNLSLVAVLAMSTFAIAGGDIAPVEEPVVVVPEVIESTGGLYLGLAYGLLNASIEDKRDVAGGTITDTLLDTDFDEIMLQAGYKFNEYVAVEGRYWFGMESTINNWNINTTANDVTIDAWGLYVKPMYPVTEAFNVYAMLGYAGADLEKHSLNYVSDSLDGFSWGIGADYSFTENVAVFVDYVSIYDDEETYAGGEMDYSIDTWNFGVTYNF
jgi:opacity protein-like surface antigen